MKKKNRQLWMNIKLYVGIYIWKDRLNKITIRKDIYHLRQE